MASTGGVLVNVRPQRPDGFDEQREMRWQKALDDIQPLPVDAALLAREDDGASPEGEDEALADSDGEAVGCGWAEPSTSSGSPVFGRRLCTAGAAHVHLCSPDEWNVRPVLRCPQHTRMQRLGWVRDWVSDEQWRHITAGEPPAIDSAATARVPCDDCEAPSKPRVRPPLPPIPPSVSLAPRTAISCTATVDSERYPQRLLDLPGAHSAAHPLLLPHATLYSTASFVGAGQAQRLCLHLRLDLPSPSSSELFHWFDVAVDGLCVNERWRDDEARRELQLRAVEPNPAVHSVTPAIRVRHNAEATASGTAEVSERGLNVTVKASNASPDCNWESVSIRWGGAKGALRYSLELRPLFIRGAEHNPFSRGVAVAEPHWSQLGDVRRGVKRPLDDDQQPLLSLTVREEPLSWMQCDDSDAEEGDNGHVRGGRLLTEPSSPSLSSGSDDDPQVATTRPSSPLSFPFQADPDYAHSARLEATLLFHLRESSVFQRGHEWIQCDACSAYRRLPEWVIMDELPTVWVCRMNPNLLMDDCDRRGEEEEMGKRGDWVEDTCAVCEKGDKAMLSGFGGWARQAEGASKLAPSAALLSSSSSSSSSPSSSSSSSARGKAATKAATGVGGFPLTSVPPARIDNPMIGCFGPCCRSFHMQCISLSTPLSAATHRQVDREWYCSDCQHGRGVCFVCGMRGSEGVELKRCGAVCGKMYHVSCMPPLWSYHRKMRRRFRNAALTENRERAKRRKSRKAKDAHNHGKEERDADDSSEDDAAEDDLDAFVCPRHWCAACGESGEDRILLRCLRCPVAYHCSAPCRPVHIQLVTERSFICSRHGEDDKDAKTARRRAGHVSLSTSTPSRASRFPQWITRAEARETKLGLKIPQTSPAGFELNPLALRLFPSVLQYHYPELPLRLSKALLLLSLGRVVADRPAFHLEWAVFPVGYKLLRTVPMASRDDVSVTLLCEVCDGGSAPLFRVTPAFLTRRNAQGHTEDVRLNKKSDLAVTDRFIDNVWHKVERSWSAWTKQRYEPEQFPIREDIPRHLQSARAPQPGVTGCARFGLLHERVTALIKLVPQTAECTRYKPAPPPPPPAELIDLTAAERTDASDTKAPAGQVSLARGPFLGTYGPIWPIPSKYRVRGPARASAAERKQMLEAARTSSSRAASNPNDSARVTDTGAAEEKTAAQQPAEDASSSPPPPAAHEKAVGAVDSAAGVTTASREESRGGRAESRPLSTSTAATSVTVSPTSALSAASSAVGSPSSALSPAEIADPSNKGAASSAALEPDEEEASDEEFTL